MGIISPYDKTRHNKTISIPFFLFILAVSHKREKPGKNTKPYYTIPSSTLVVILLLPFFFLFDYWRDTRVVEGLLRRVLECVGCKLILVRWLYSVHLGVKVVVIKYLGRGCFRISWLILELVYFFSDCVALPR